MVMAKMNIFDPFSCFVLFISCFKLMFPWLLWSHFRGQTSFFISASTPQRFTMTLRSFSFRVFFQRFSLFALLSLVKVLFHNKALFPPQQLHLLPWAIKFDHLIFIANSLLPDHLHQLHSFSAKLFAFCISFLFKLRALFCFYKPLVYKQLDFGR